MTKPRELSLFQAAEQLRRGELSAEALLLSCLERIEARQPEIRAWVRLYSEEALETARRQDRDSPGGRWRGPLHGIPLGIKDIIDVQGMETKAGSEAYDGGEAEADAPVVAALRDAGAIVLGKTVTTPFAFRDPSATRNPWNPAHSPGGSSAGSGAAVADRMCLAALGTQTAGSVLRPAAFNGVVGFKSGYGEVSVEGVVPLSWQFDHVGTLTRTVEDAHLLWHIMRTRRTLDWQSTREKLPSVLLPKGPRRIWRVRDFFETESSPECLNNLEAVCRELAASGVEIVERSLPISFAKVRDTYRMILTTEAALFHRESYAMRKHLYTPHLAELFEAGLQVRAVDYVAAVRHRSEMRKEIAEILAGVDAAIMSSALTSAPLPDTTGDPLFNMPWSVCGIPALSLPSGLSDSGLPLGVQLVSGPGAEEELLSTGGWVESLLAFHGAPP